MDNAHNILGKKIGSARDPARKLLMGRNTENILRVNFKPD